MTTREAYVLEIAKMLMIQRPDASRGQIAQWACDTADVWLSVLAKPPSTVLKADPSVSCCFVVPEDDDDA